jgi:hypothetical protein
MPHDHAASFTARHTVPRVLVFSQRHIYEREVWRCAFHEFEGILQGIESVRLLAPEPTRWYQEGKRVALRLGERFRLPLNPGIQRITLDEHYDLFFAVCEKPSELLNLAAVKGWKERCATSICWLIEFYVKDMDMYKSALEVLSQFDHVLFMFAASDPFQRVIRGRGHYLPAGIDALRFCPFPEPPTRSIDVLSIGRRSATTHQSLLEMAKTGRIFYVYDTFDNLHTYDLGEHRSLMADLLKRCRYFIVNPGKINAPEATGGQSEFGYRYFEGAAPGAIMIGQRPANKEFGRIFHWEDAVIDLSFGSDGIGHVLAELDRQPERQVRIRKTNMTESLLHHDWAYRWEAILEMAGLRPLPQLLERKQRLSDRASIVEKA